MVIKSTIQIPQLPNSKFGPCCFNGHIPGYVDNRGHSIFVTLYRLQSGSWLMKYNGISNYLILLNEEWFQSFFKFHTSDGDSL